MKTKFCHSHFLVPGPTVKALDLLWVQKIYGGIVPVHVDGNRKLQKTECVPTYRSHVLVDDLRFGLGRRKKEGKFYNGFL